MIPGFRLFAMVLGLAMFVVAGLQPAEARRDVISNAGKCYIISSSFHGTNPPKALRQARDDLELAIKRLSNKEGWKNPRVSAQRVRPNPTLRSEVTADVMLKPDVKTSRSYTQCWEGVIWPYVCTSGAKLCPR